MPVTRPGPGTLAARRYPDDVPDQEKMRRFRKLEELQAEISSEIHRSCLDQAVEVLIEERHKEQWKGRTKTNKIVFIDSSDKLLGKTVSAGLPGPGHGACVQRSSDLKELLRQSVPATEEG